MEKPSSSSFQKLQDWSFRTFPDSQTQRTLPSGGQESQTAGGLGASLVLRATKAEMVELLISEGDQNYASTQLRVETKSYFWLPCSLRSRHYPCTEEETAPGEIRCQS